MKELRTKNNSRSEGLVPSVGLDEKLQNLGLGGVSQGFRSTTRKDLKTSKVRKRRRKDRTTDDGVVGSASGTRVKKGGVNWGW